MPAQRLWRTYSKLPNNLRTLMAWRLAFTFIRFVPCLTFGKSDCRNSLSGIFNNPNDEVAKKKIAMPSQNEEELNTAERAAREAGRIIKTLFKGKFDVHEKSKNNPVTTADLEANRKIREILQGRFPEDGWLSEEDSDDSRRLTSSRVWIIDPIDGTKEFIEGVPQFAVSIGFVVRGRPKVAVIYNPVEDRLYRAAAGQGAELNGERIRVTPRREVRGA